MVLNISEDIYDILAPNYKDDDILKKIFGSKSVPTVTKEYDWWKGTNIKYGGFRTPRAFIDKDGTAIAAIPMNMNCIVINISGIPVVLGADELYRFHGPRVDTAGYFLQFVKPGYRKKILKNVL